MIKRALERYNAPTPYKYQVWSEIILGFGTVMQVSLQSVDVSKEWTIALAVLTGIGTVLPKFAKLQEPPAAAESTESTEA